MSLAGASRWLREGPLATRLPWRVRNALESWTASHAYPSAGRDLTIRVADDGVDAPSISHAGDDRRSATLLFGGDVALHRWDADARIDEVFGGLGPVLESCDARFYNLESQLTSRTQPAGTVGAFLRAEPAAVAALHALGATAVTCANNHCLDHGAEGLAESVATLDANGIAVCGVPRGDDCGATVVPVNDTRIGLLAYTDDWHEPMDATARPMPVAHEPSRVLADIAATRERADIVAVQLHWGWEYTVYPLRTLRDWGRSYVEAGADLVICHHAHVPLGVERWLNGVIAHGLGNLYFGARRSWSHPFGGRSFVLKVSVSGRGVTDADVVPVHTAEDGRVVVSDGRARDEMLRVVAYLSRRLDADAYLDRVELHVLAMQGALVLQDLAQRLSDPGGARERIRFMRCPRQRWLVEEMQRHGSAATGVADGTTRVAGSAAASAGTQFLREGGRLLEQLRDSPHDIERADARDRIAALGGTAAAWLRRAVPVGRVP